MQKITGQKRHRLFAYEKLVGILSQGNERTRTHRLLARRRRCLRVGGMLATGLALLLTIAIILWADENERRISEWGHFGAGLVTIGIVMLGWRAFTKSHDL